MDRETAHQFDAMFHIVESALPPAALAARIALNGIRAGVVELNQYATRDGLTGLPNYRALQERDEMQQLHFAEINNTGVVAERRADAPKAVVGWWVEYLDLNKFKLVNDRLGHPIGHRVLRVFATAISISVREVDEVYRDGGDEFIVFAPVTEQPPEGHSFGTELSDRLRQNLQFLRGPRGSEYLPSGLELGPLDHTALDLIDWTIGEAFVPGIHIDRFVELEKADANMRALKSGQPRT